jgi:hypothetical protein
MPLYLVFLLLAKFCQISTWKSMISTLNKVFYMEKIIQISQIFKDKFQ